VPHHPVALASDWTHTERQWHIRERLYRHCGLWYVLQYEQTSIIGAMLLMSRTRIGQPHPGLNDIAHTYTFYLFQQPANFTLPSWDAGRVFNPISVSARMNFSVTAVADVVGAPLAANYMRVINPNTTAPGTFLNGTCPTGAPNGTVTPYTGAAIKLQGLASAVVVVLGYVVFALL